jgi:hypothetical protein
LAEIGKRLVYRVHAIERMVKREISTDDVRAVVEEGKVIESYPSDFPYPSRLLLGWRGIRPIHVVTADSAVDDETIIITVYEPDPSLWEPNFEKRKLQ